MSQYGMQMPGGQMRRGASLNIYTGILFLAVVALGAACIFMYFAASKIGKDGSAFGIQQAPKGGVSQVKFGN
ncbi:MAG: hypothetical protein ACREJO_15510 [Phycisphaerales bacterium]